MLRLYQIAHGRIQEVAIEPGRLSEQIREVDWIDALEPDEEERALLATLFSDAVPDSDDVEEIETSARCFSDQDGIHVHSLFLGFSEGRHHTVSVAFVLQAQRLIAIRDGELSDFRLLRMRARRGQVSCETPAELLLTLLEQKVENHADNIEDIHYQLERVSHSVLEEVGTDLEEVISQLSRLEDSNGKIRLCLMDTQRDILFLLRHMQAQMEQRETLNEIVRDLETLMTHTSFLFDKINFLMDSTQGFINIRQAQIIKIFSIAAVVFLPPTLLASIYGMNFRFMPELGWHYGYPLAIVMMIAAAIAPYLFFKHKGWL
jgi:magnesium transporter